MKALIVEDEPLARLTLREYLEQETDVELVGEAADGLKAVAEIERLRPDLVFLDVHLPEISGLEVLEVLERVDPPPAVVFTTAYDRYAVTAFELEAVDYLVKPFGLGRFRATLDRVRRRAAEGAGSAWSTGLRSGLVERPLSRLYARKGDRIVPVPVVSIERIEGAGDYSELHCASQRYLVALRLKDLEARLDGERFLRIHRSRLVNMDRVTSIQVRDSHRFQVVLASGAVAIASRTGSARLRRRMRS